VRSLRSNRIGSRLLVSLLGVALTLTACSSTDSGEPSPEKDAAANEPRLELLPKDAAKEVSPIEPVKVRASNGTIDEVSLTNPQGKEVKGSLAKDKASWASAEPLGYDREYTLKASIRGKDGKTVREESSFTTVSPAGTVYPSFLPPPKITTVGVGQPIAVIFDTPPPDQAAAERALKVTATPEQEGSWYWWDDRTVHYRPKDYWKPGTKVTVDAKIYGVNLGGGLYGDTDRTLNLTIGPEKIATIDDKTHRMVVTVNGKAVKTFPVSMGRSGSTTGKDGEKISFVTPSGTYVAQEKYAVKRMNSESYGLPSDASLGYDEKIPLAVRVSNSGIFVHAAPWSVADQGRRNVSHGCVNLSPEAGRWFYDNFSYGDIVNIHNTSTKLEPTDGFGDWNIPWEEWVKGSALN
jgi:lipoprotein-anchoring transpeptidase ErfK/SrfK